MAESAVMSPKQPTGQDNVLTSCLDQLHQYGQLLTDVLTAPAADQLQTHRPLYFVDTQVRHTMQQAKEHMLSTASETMHQAKSMLSTASKCKHYSRSLKEHSSPLPGALHSGCRQETLAQHPHC